MNTESNFKDVPDFRLRNEPLIEAAIMEMRELQHTWVAEQFLKVASAEVISKIKSEEDFEKLAKWLEKEGYFVGYDISNRGKLTFRRNNEVLASAHFKFTAHIDDPAHP